MIEYLVAHGFTLLMLKNFAVFGIILNFASVILVVFAMMLKSSTINEEELVMLQSFLKARRTLVDAYASDKRKVLRALLVFLPTYKAYMNCIYLWALMSKPGTRGIIKAELMVEKYSLLPLLKLEDLKVQ